MRLQEREMARQVWLDTANHSFIYLPYGVLVVFLHGALLGQVLLMVCLMTSHQVVQEGV